MRCIARCEVEKSKSKRCDLAKSVTGSPKLMDMTHYTGYICLALLPASGTANHRVCGWGSAHQQDFGVAVGVARVVCKAQLVPLLTRIQYPLAVEVEEVGVVIAVIHLAPANQSNASVALSW